MPMSVADITSWLQHPFSQMGTLQIPQEGTPWLILIDQNWFKNWNLLAILGFANSKPPGNVKPLWFSFEYVPVRQSALIRHLLYTAVWLPQNSSYWVTWIGSSFSGDRVTGKAGDLEGQWASRGVIWGMETAPWPLPRAKASHGIHSL